MNDLKIPSPLVGRPGYEEDLVGWMERQIELLRMRKFDQLDLENLLGELEGMVRSERRALRSRLEVVTLHLLKYQFQPARRSRSWLATLGEQRRKVCLMLEDSPSLRPALGDYLEAGYPSVVKRASAQTGLPPSACPADCPYTVRQVLDEDFLP